MQETVKTNTPYGYNGSSFIKKYLYILLGIAIVSIFYYKQVDKQPPINTIFYQPLLKDKMEWNDNFKKLQQAGIKTIILQWSKFGVVDFLKDELWLTNILSSAQEHQIKVIVGLYGDDKYFKTLENRDTNIQNYLNRLLIQNIKQAKSIYKIAQHYHSFNGYYIYDEIEDTNFKTQKRQAYLKEYLEEMANRLEKISTHKRYISGYFSRHMSAHDYARMLSDITQNRYTLLLQSGIGAKLVNSKSSSLYMQTFKNEFNGIFSPIVEGFTMNNKKIQAIDIVSLKKQINMLKKSSNSSNLTLFSLRYFLEDRLYHDYLLEYCKTKR